MKKSEDYEIKLILRAFHSALIMWGENALRENPGLLILEAESLRNLDAFLSTSNKKFTDYKLMKVRKIKNASI